MPKPTKPDIAKFKVMKDMGLTPNAIGKRTGFDSKTVRAYLSSEVYADPDIQQMIELIKGKELNDLHLIGGKARAVLNGYLDSVMRGEKEPNPVAIVAIQDRSFQQRRLLEGLSTENIGVKGLVAHIQTEIEVIRKRKEELLSELEDAGE
ncbi:MAG: hypothetical protein K8I01_12625 [Candidatus Methylomirabilis sp.]|nr:hypothetical protein [Deltaproteobacteria bacterium]